MLKKTLSNRLYQSLKSKIKGTDIQSFINKLISTTTIINITIIINSLTNTSKNNNKQCQIINETTLSNLHYRNPKFICVTENTQ